MFEIFIHWTTNSVYYLYWLMHKIVFVKIIFKNKSISKKVNDIHSCKAKYKNYIDCLNIKKWPQTIFFSNIFLQDVLFQYGLIFLIFQKLPKILSYILYVHTWKGHILTFSYRLYNILTEEIFRGSGLPTKFRENSKWRKVSILIFMKCINVSAQVFL